MTRSAYALYFLANLAPRALMFLLLLVLTRLMPMGEYGLFVLVVTTGEIFDMALCNWVRVFALRSEGASATMRPYRLGRLLALTFATTGLAFLLAGASGLLRQEQSLAFTVSVAAMILAFAPLRLSLMLLQVQRKHSAYAAVEALRAGGTFAATGAAMLLLPPDFLNASLALAAATATAGLVGLWQALGHVPRPRRARRGYGAALAFGLPIAVAQVLVYALGYFDRYIVDFLLGPHAVAVLAAAYSLGRQPIELFIGPLNNYAFPHLVKIYEHEGPEAAATAQAGLLATLVTVGSAIVMGLILLTDPLLTIALPADYHAEAALLLPWIAFGSLALLVKYFIFDNAFHLAKRTWLQPVAMLPPAIFGLVACFLLVPRFGIVGAGISFAVGACFAALTTAVITSRILPVRMPWGMLARIVLANACASCALYTLRGFSEPAGPLVVLVASTLAFIAVYAAALTLIGVSLRRTIETPWASVAPRPREPMLKPILQKP
ncbi:O-antigen/teichoic acid export membrane protein [Methylobacterium sp. BE186]|uniref:lipopolysaccharide biosynthesis protein n=1 Tax=Methylobacterium sp. BE186 TaxID=2817715 RepID=UPI002857DE45|nr:lipopolysaccharide biosynthesis protein [Methylobacterium sp. BE186]MDR7037942.1 O-antigen/teichoic acid export membrane protein [Methylobacterium sp. BE186]